MNVLWIINGIREHQYTMLGMDRYSGCASGTWLEAAYCAAQKQTDIQLHLATVYDVPKLMYDTDEGNSFYILPNRGKCAYDYHDNNNKLDWQIVREIAKPDVVVVWGTEMPHAYCAMKAMKNIPTVIFVQGIIRTIYDHMFDGWPSAYHCCTLRDYVDKFSNKSMMNKFKSQLPLEKEMFEMAEGVIVENIWAEYATKAINPELRIYYNKLPIKQVFFHNDWQIDDIEPFSIFTNAGGYPIKGHHILFKALAIVKKRLPNFKCYIPGTRLSVFNSIKRKTGYTQFLNKLIDEGNLRDNIIYVGGLSSEEMVDRIKHCNVYVMPSIVENHSSSLIEAKLIGAPCISSMAGGSFTLINHEKNGLLYNSLDPEMLAGCIIRVLENKQYAETLTKNRDGFRMLRRDNFGNQMNDIYSELLKNKKVIF